VRRSGEDAEAPAIVLRSAVSVNRPRMAVE
jgi:hypothetical protein